ncbi:SGNH/GDSL hydrolase family protein [Paenibacillus flagellatus]|uniref:SGNH hydrolase-type esterase domain-containing protein n=1 Tax=Paenibacillus flagellatus TaxID=2211139 RepID=A0A2V5K9Q0_9BACL|nr:SGNH/GDSL hydrolase family protein [Paenibacillus flagellatus]PYI56231.1 hypothetical protein DLM86_04390 [Paenibacillus flagellatus]
MTTVNPNEKQSADYALRSGMRRFAGKLKPGGAVTVAFLGGSVTAGAGSSDGEKTSYRALTCDYLRRRFPETSFAFVNAAIGGTDSTYGAFRLREHVLAKGPIDALFVEFAVNDGGDRAESIRAMEGIVRHAKRAAPEIDLCFLYTANRPTAERYGQEGRMQSNVYHHEEVAEHYGIPSVRIAETVYRMIAAGSLRWEHISGDSVHPNDYGYSLYADCIRAFLDEALPTAAGHAAEPPAAPPERIDPFCYERGSMPEPAAAADEAAGFRTVKGWTAERTCNWSPPADIVVGDRPGDSLRFRFSGTAAGVSLLAGMDTGRLDVSIDGEPYRTIELFDEYCPKFYRPKIAMLAKGLDPGEHTVSLRVSEGRHEGSEGTAVRLLRLLVNGEAGA